MKVFFAAGDVGGSRALLPVITECANRGILTKILSHGFLAGESNFKHLHVKMGKGQTASKLVESLVHTEGVNNMLFASSVTDALPLDLAVEMKRRGVNTVHLLDHWSSYRERVSLSNGNMFQPDVYAVMDRLAYDAAVQAGVRKDVLRITGHPNLWPLRGEADSWRSRDRSGEREERGIDASKKTIIFVSEPLKADDQSRGYTIADVLTILRSALGSRNDWEIAVVPHPRDDLASVKRDWQAFDWHQRIHFISLNENRRLLFLADAVVGMASMLLYEAWLLNLPVACIQPGLRLASLRMMERDGVLFVDSMDGAVEGMVQWMDSLVKVEEVSFRDDLRRHEKAVENVVALLKK